MPASLTPCSACRRHARADEPACPFCGGALTAPRALAQVDTRGLSRAAVISLAASLGLVACASEETPLYGAPAPRYEGGAGGASAGSSGAAGEGGAAGAAGEGGEAGAGGK